MARPRRPTGRVPTPGPWIVCAEPHTAAPLADVSGDGSAPEEQVGGSYLIRPQGPLAPGDPALPLAYGIRNLADGTLMAAVPDLAAALLALLTAPDLMRRDLDPQTRATISAAWDLLVRVAPHLEI